MACRVAACGFQEKGDPEPVGLRGEHRGAGLCGWGGGGAGVRGGGGLEAGVCRVGGGGGEWGERPPLTSGEKKKPGEKMTLQN